MLPGVGAERLAGSGCWRFARSATRGQVHENHGQKMALAALICEGFSTPAPRRLQPPRYSLNSVFGALAILMSVSASLRSCLRNAAKPAGSVAAGTTACFSRKATNFGSLNTF